VNVRGNYPKVDLFQVGVFFRILPESAFVSYTVIEGSLEAKLPTIWTVQTQSREEAERREKIRRKKR
jgi:hypothetical protein